MTTAAPKERRQLNEDGRLVAIGPWPHGEVSTYNYHMCRCIPCTTAWRDAVTARRQERQKLLVDRGGRMVTTANVPHGRASTYQNWLCHCKPCKNAATRRKKEWRRTRNRKG